MEKKNNELNFHNQHVYVGIDVHKEQWSVTINVQGNQIRTLSINSQPEELSKHLKKHYPGGIYHSVYEAGFCGYWIDRRLKAIGIDNIVVNAADVPTSCKEQVTKTDRNDSRKLAREFSCGSLRGIYVPTKEQEAQRVLSRLRIQLTRDQSRVKNRIKSLLNYLGVEFPANIQARHWSGRFIQFLRGLRFEEPELKQALEEHLKELTSLREQLSDVMKSLRTMVSNEKEKEQIVKRLMTVPGIGFITAVNLYTEIIDIKRFKSIDHLCSYVGLAPATYSSGEKEVVLGLTKRQNTNLRNLLIEASWIAVRKDPALLRAFVNLTRRMKKQEAIIRIAKKLLRRVMHVWKEKEEYVLAVVK